MEWRGCSSSLDKHLECLVLLLSLSGARLLKNGLGQPRSGRSCQGVCGHKRLGVGGTTAGTEKWALATGQTSHSFINDRVSSSVKELLNESPPGRWQGASPELLQLPSEGCHLHGCHSVGSVGPGAV